jgi:tetratricopeptide (TPR) repeat protein
MFCVTCGTQLLDSAGFCINCGSHVYNIPETGPPASIDKSPKEESSEALNKPVDAASPTKNPTTSTPHTVEASTGVRTSGYFRFAPFGEEILLKHALTRYRIAALAALGAGFGGMIWSLLFSGEKQASKAWPTAIVLATIGYILYDYLIEPLFHGSEKEHGSRYGEVKRVGRIVLREGAPYVFFTVLLHIYLSSIAEDWKFALDWLALFVASGALTLGWLNGIRFRPSTAARQGASTSYVATLWISTFLIPIFTLYATLESGGLDINNVFSFFGFYYVGFVYLTTLYAYIGGLLIDRTQSLPRAWQFSIGTVAVIILQSIAVLAASHWYKEASVRTLLLRPVLMGIGWCVALLPCLEFRKPVTLRDEGQPGPEVVPESIGSTAEKITRSVSSWVVINIGALFLLAGILWVIWATYNNWMADVLVVLGALILATGQVMRTGGSVDRAGVITVALAVTMLLASWATLWWGHNHDAQFESKYHYMRGLDQDKNGEWEAAIREYTAAQRKDPESVEIQKRLAWTYLNHGDPKNAETESRAILSRDPNNLGEVHCILALALLHLHNVDWSVAESRHTISNSNPACAHYALARRGSARPEKSCSGHSGVHIGQGF